MLPNVRRQGWWVRCLPAVLLWPLVGAWAQTPSNTPRPDMWFPTSQFVDTVYAVAASNGIVYIGGDFNYVGPNTGSGALLDATTGALAARPPETDGMVRAACPDGSGGWFIGGSFTQVQGVLRSGLAHVFADGTLDTAWAADVDLPIGGDRNVPRGVQGLRLSGSTLYVGGFFTTIHGQPRNRLAALDAATGNVLAWDPNVTGGSNTMVRNIIVAGGLVYIGGNFTTIGAGPGAVPRANLAAIDASTGVATNWAPDPNGNVRALALSGTTLYVGGSFSTISATPRNRIAAYDTTTSTLTTWDPGLNVTVSSVEALAVSGSTVFLGGWFYNLYNDQTWTGLAAVDAATGAVVAAWNPGADSQVNWLDVQGSTLYVAGWFSTIAGRPQQDLAGLDTTTGNLTWSPATDGNIGLFVAPSGSTVFVGGNWASVGGVYRNGLAALDEITGQATAWNPNVNAGGSYSAVYALAVSGNTVYAGGYFTTIGSGTGAVTRNNIAAIDATTGLATDWDPYAYFSDGGGEVDALAVSPDGNTVYAGGHFDHIGGTYRSYIAALDATPGSETFGLATDWNPGSNGEVVALALSSDGNTIYAGGYFTYIGGAPRNYIAALDTTVATPPPTSPARGNRLADGVSGDATPWDPNANSWVNSLALSADGNTVYAGGAFTSIGSGESVLTRNRIAAIDANPNSATFMIATSWDPNANSNVEALAVAGGDVYTGGYFSNIGGQTRFHLASLGFATDTQNATAWNPLVSGNVYGLQVTNLAIYAGGDVSGSGGPVAPKAPASSQSVNSLAHPFFAAFPFDTTAPIVTALNPADDATGVAVDTNLSMTFSENIYKGQWGFITIKKQADDSVFQQIVVTDASVTASGNNTVTITLAGPLAYGTGYYVQIGNQCFKDASGNFYAGIADKTTWNFATILPVKNVTSTKDDGTYGKDVVIAVQVQFKAPVTVTGTPQLTLNVNGPGAVVNYSSGSGTDTLTFSYTVAAGDNSPDLDYTSTTALALNGGTIQNGSISADPTLPAPGAAGSLGANKNIVIDTTPPVVELSNLNQTYDGTPKPATGTTVGESLPVTLTYDGSSTAPTLPGSYNVVGTATDAAGNVGSTSGTLVIALAATASASASPSTGPVSLQVSFAGSATGLGSGLSYSWNFGDGSAAGSGQDVVHTFSSVGTYNVVLTVTDSNGVSVTAGVSVQATASDIFPLDSDKDGFPDEIETALGSDPKNPASTPFGLPSPVPGGNPAIRQLQIRLDFFQPVGHDSITLQGKVRVRSNFSPSRQYVILDVGGVVKAFVLDAHGRSKSGNDQFRLSNWSRKSQPVLPNANYSVSLRKGTFAATLQNRGFVNSNIEYAGLFVPVIMILDGQDSRTVGGQNYQAKAGLWGRSK